MLGYLCPCSLRREAFVNIPFRLVISVPAPRAFKLGHVNSSLQTPSTELAALILREYSFSLRWLDVHAGDVTIVNFQDTLIHDRSPKRREVREREASRIT